MKYPCMIYTTSRNHKGKTYFAYQKHQEIVNYTRDVNKNHRLKLKLIT